MRPATCSGRVREPLSSSALDRSRKQRRGTELVCERVFRPLAHPLVLLFARLRVPPPAVIVASAAAGIAAAVQLGRGSLLAADLTPKGYKEVSRTWLFAAREPWTLPVLSRGSTLCCAEHSRHDAGTTPRLLCYDLRA